MENVFSSSEAINRKVEINDDTVNVESRDLDEYFDIEKCIAWIKNHNNHLKKIALQFPDELLQYAVKVQQRLQQRQNTCLFFLLADTSYGNCCVDVVAAEHYNADAVIHYGHACLSPVDQTKIPVFYVFEKKQLDLTLVNTELEQIVADQRVVVLYDVCYYHLYPSMKNMFEANNDNIYVTDIVTNNISSNDQKTLYARILPSDLDMSRTTFFYVGTRQALLNSFQFYFNKSTFYQFKDNQVHTFAFAQTNRELMKRFYLIEKARDAQIFGILVGTMSVAQYREAIDHVSSLLRKAKRRYYSFLIGKINCAKLNNFMEVDVYVLVACNENSLINSKEFNKPVITVYELEMAFNCARAWGSEFVCDYRQLLSGAEHFVEAQMSELESDVSLITGGARFLQVSKETEEAHEQSLVRRDEALSVLHYSGAGEYLQSRTWKGLEQNLGENEVSKAVEGRKGIAASYHHEPNENNRE